MSDGIKTTYRIEYRIEFPRIGRVLTVEFVSDEGATIKISRSDNAKLLRLKKFSGYNEAMNYYSEQLNNLKSAEEYETMKVAFKTLGFM